MLINDGWKVVSNLASDKQAGRISSAIEAQNRVYASALGLESPSGGASPQDESLPISEEQAKRIADALEAQNQLLEQWIASVNSGFEGLEGSAKETGEEIASLSRSLSSLGFSVENGRLCVTYVSAEL